MFEDIVLREDFNLGNGDAIYRIYQRYKNDMLKLAVALLHDEAIAEDVLNDTFVALAESVGKTRLTGNLRSYLTTCIVNRVRNVYKAKGRRKTLRIEDTAEVQSDSKGPLQSSSLKEEYQLLEAEMAQLLVANGADVNAKDKRGRTPLHSAVWNDYVDVCTFLISQGADVQAQDKQGLTPLNLAEAESHDSIIQLLRKQPVK